GVDHVRVPDPVGPLVTARALDAGDRYLRRWGVSLRIVVHEQHPVLVHGRPCGGTCAQRYSAGVRDLLATTVAAPTPVVERTGHLVPLDRALRQIATHVTTIGVE